MPAALPVVSYAGLFMCVRRYLLGAALLAGGLPERFISVGAEAGGICGRAGAAPVVMP